MRGCVEQAIAEHKANDPQWETRLWQFATQLPLSDLTTVRDASHCPAYSGHWIYNGSLVEHQLDIYSWLPSSYGPASRGQCFLRLATRRFISKGGGEEELGDQVLPYVVVSDEKTYARLRELGLPVLEDTTLSPETLEYALYLLGQTLNSAKGHAQFIEVRSRWRAVRNAIQDIYRKLNQHSSWSPKLQTHFAIRCPTGIEFHTGPLYYSEPGSSVERAFQKELRLLDADRAYPKFFAQLGITRLITGQTVKEQITNVDNAVLTPEIQVDISERLSPWLISALMARSDKTQTFGESITRRLRERFTAKYLHELTVSYTLIAKPELTQVVRFPKFYLQIQTGQGSGAPQEKHYTLYIVATGPITFADLDGDALGTTLVQLFADDASEDIRGLFPRIVSRYRDCGGNHDVMGEYLYNQLNISKESTRRSLEFI